MANQPGISTELFDKSLAKFTKTVGEARSGTGTLITILKKANPELLKQLVAVDSLGEAFDLYLKAIRDTPNALDKAALATAAFGRTGAKFINITENSAAQINKPMEEMRKNGLMTEEQAADADDWNDAMNSKYVFTFILFAYFFNL